jgi:MoaA/NifB/PqqE/SkfB family radical SAM enzyme
MIEKIKKTVVILGYTCNNNCVFCVYSQKDRNNDRPFKQIKEEIIGAKTRGTNYLELIGGETTIRKDFLEILQFAKKLEFKTISITTNGRAFCYPEYAKKILEAGLSSIVFSIHGHNAALHDALTQVPGSFEQLMKGIQNVQKLGFKNIGSNTTIVKKNYKHLEEIGEFIYKLGIRNSEFISVDPNQGGAFVDFKKMVPRISESAPYIRKCLKIGKERKIPHWHIRYVPLCFFEDYLEQISELQEVEKFETEHIAPDFVNLDVEKSRVQIGRTKASRCKDCELDDICEGIWTKYVEEFGSDELSPILK